MRNTVLCLSVLLSMAACSSAKPDLSAPPESNAKSEQPDQTGGGPSAIRTAGKRDALLDEIALESAMQPAASAGARPHLPVQALAQRKAAGAPAQALMSAEHRGFAPAVLPVPPPQGWASRGEGYEYLAENDFRSSRLSPLSTFGLDVDTASYSNIRRFLQQGQLPPVEAVRVEELINYFDYAPHPQAVEDEQPLYVRSELGVAPWNPQHRLLMLRIDARSIKRQQMPAQRLVFLIDSSGSMQQSEKLPLLKRSFYKLVEQLGQQDQVAIVSYAGQAGLVLPPTSGDQKQAIYSAISRLQAGGSTAGGQGIELAYRLARQSYSAEANNRVILATDGDFNVGASSQAELIKLIEARRDEGIFLSVLGFGTGNYQGGKMQRLSSHGNGTHHYIDSDQEADRVLRENLVSSLNTVAKDAKIQVEFNPAKVARYRLIGYENRRLNAEDFADDRKDAGDVGAGHSLVVLYELEPAGSAPAKDSPDTESLRYQTSKLAAHAQEWARVQWRAKAPDSDQSQQWETIVKGPVDGGRAEGAASQDFRWASAVAEFGLLLRESKHRGKASYDAVIQRAEELVAEDANALRQEFLSLLRQAKLAQQTKLSQAETPAGLNETIRRWD